MRAIINPAMEIEISLFVIALGMSRPLVIYSLVSVKHCLDFSNIVKVHMSITRLLTIGVGKGQA